MLASERPSTYASPFSDSAISLLDAPAKTGVRVAMAATRARLAPAGKWARANAAAVPASRQ